MRRIVLALCVLVALISLQVAGSRRAHAGGPPELGGSVPAGGGFALVVWNGGPVDRLRFSLADQGCGMTSAWVTVSGEMVGYVPFAPGAVNAAFVGLYPSGVLPTSTLLMVVCRARQAQLPVSGTDALPVQVLVHADAEVTAANITIARTGLSMAEQHLAQTFGSGVLALSSVQLHAGAEGEPLADASGSVCCYTRSGQVHLYPEHRTWVNAATWVDSPFRVDMRYHIAAHEYVHLWAAEVGCSARLPAWFVEGLAEYVAFEADVRRGLITATNRHDYNVLQAADVPSAVSLEAMESRAVLYEHAGAYALSELAVERLMAGRPAAALHDFCVDAAAGVPWKTAFEGRFGVSSTAFYAQLEAARPLK